jgi:hypothetical protein
MDCTRTSADHAQLTGDDQSTPSHLQVVRKIGGAAAFDLDVCAADLTIKAGHDDEFRLTVDFDSATSKVPAGDYLQALDVSPRAVSLKLYLPKRPRAKIVILLPATTPRLQLNLVRGDLLLQTDRIHGERKINVVLGNVGIFANPDSYATLHASVLLGSFHDRRPGGDGDRGMVSQSLSGTGQGSIEVNVVRGNVDLKPWD